MSDDLREVKAIITSNPRQNLDGNNKQQDTIYSSFDLPLKTLEDIEGAVEQFLQNENNFERSVILYIYSVQNRKIFSYFTKHEYGV